MKAKSIALTLLAVAMVTLVSASGNLKINVHPIDSDKLAVLVLNSDDFNVEIGIYAENGDIVYYKQTENPITSFEQLFDLTKMQNGSYVMEVKANNTKLKQNLLVTSNKIYVKESDYSIDPYFLFDGKNLKFSYLNFNEENFKIEILGQSGLVYKNNIGSSFPILGGYDLSKLEMGNYLVVLHSKKRTYSYEFKKQ